jgi:hypothetical protein
VTFLNTTKDLTSRLAILWVALTRRVLVEQRLDGRAHRFVQPVLDRIAPGLAQQ